MQWLGRGKALYIFASTWYDYGMGEIILCIVFFVGLFFLQQVFEHSDRKTIIAVAVVYIIAFPVALGLLGRVFE